MPSFVNADNGVVSGTAGLKSSADNSGVLDLQTNGTTAISISASQVVTFANQPAYTGGTANGVLYLNASKVLTSGSALTFDGTTLNNSGGFSSSTAALTLKNTSSASTSNIVEQQFWAGNSFSGLVSVASFGADTSVGVGNQYGSLYWKTANAGAPAERMRLDSSGQLQMVNSSGTAMNALKGSNFGYSSSYKALILGSTSGTFTPCINVDPSGNASGSFSGNGGEVMFRNGVTFIQPNAANNTFQSVMAFSSGGTGVQFNAGISVGGTAPSSEGAGIKFPATQVSSSDANTLDDYEEGSWTPSYIGTGSNPTVTYGAQIGKYVKIGKFVWVGCNIHTTAASGGSGNLRIFGLPFACAANSMNDLGITIGLTAYWGTGAPIAGGIQNSQSYISLFSAMNVDQLVTSLGTGGSANYIRFQACYETT
jgi:adhesin HecA-like repeat protein